MADVFVSYSSKDREKAALLVDVLKAQGWTVWWDRDIAPGQSWDDSIHQGMTEARVMIVLWSPNSAASRMVKDEANNAANRDALVPAMIEACEIPYGYGMLQAANLTDWDGETEHEGLVQLLAATRKLLGRKTETIKAPPKRRRVKRWLVPLALLAPLPLAAAAGALPLSRFRVRAEVRASEVHLRLEGRGNTLEIPLLVLRASRIASAALPPARDTAGGLVETDRISMSVTPPPAAPAGTNGPVFAMMSLRQDMITLKPMILPDSAALRLVAGDQPRELILELQHPALAAVTIPVSGKVLVLAGRRLNHTFDFQPGEAVVQPDGGTLSLDVSLTDTAAIVSRRLAIRGIDFWRVDPVREGDAARDERVSTIAAATVQLREVEQPGPALSEGMALVLDDARGELVDLRLTPGGIQFTFDGTVRSLGAGQDAETRPYRISRLSALAANRMPLLLAGVALYVTAAVVLAVTTRKRWW